MEKKGLRVNVIKTKGMLSQRDAAPHNKIGKHPCGVCLKGVGSNSILCPHCKLWVHKRCSKIKGNLTAVRDFKCPSCIQGLNRTKDNTIQLGEDSLELVDEFCYLGDMLDSGGGAESATITRVKCGWKKFRDLQPLLTSHSISLNTKGALYRTCVQNVMIYGGETWPVKADDIQRLHRNEMAMIRWMCGTSLKQKDCPPCDTLRSKLGVKPIQDVLQQRRLRWFGHIERRAEDCWARKVYVLQTPEKALLMISL